MPPSREVVRMIFSGRGGAGRATRADDPLELLIREGSLQASGLGVDLAGEIGAALACVAAPLREVVVGAGKARCHRRLVDRILKTVGQRGADGGAPIRRG